MKNESLDKAENAIRRLKEATREANESFSVLSKLLKEVNDLRKKSFDEEIEDKVKEGLEQYQETLEAAMKSAEKAMHDRFDTLTAILLDEDKKALNSDKPNIFELGIAKKAAEYAVNEFREKAYVSKDPANLRVRFTE